MSGKKPSVHTVPSQNGWVNKQGGKATSSHLTKAAAEAEGRRQAQRSETEHIIHKLNGQIGAKNSYGIDPCPPKDKR